MLKAVFFAAVLSAAPACFADESLDVTALSNGFRAEGNLGEVLPDENLNAIATRFAGDMRMRNYFSHRSPDGATMVTRLRDGGAVYRAAGENIAKGQKSPRAVMTAWMNSPGHRANIMNGRYHRIGIGHAGDYWVMILTD